MSYHPITPFRGAHELVLPDQGRQALSNHAPTRLDKWTVLNELTAAREHFGLSNRELTVLQALLSFHPARELEDTGDGIIVFPSNATICERLNGMPCSTMRRHIARLVASGVILRKDSPNGKRYRRRTTAFGFDLAPLLHRFPEITFAAKQAEEEREERSALKTDISLMYRDLMALIHNAGGESGRMDQLNDRTILLRTRSKRKLSIKELREVRAEFAEMLVEFEPSGIVEDADMSTRDAENEHHIYSQKKENSVTRGSKEMEISLSQVTQACPELRSFGGDPGNSWDGFIRCAEKVRPMMGISASLWDRSKRVMGMERAAIVLAAMLERFAEIKSPGAYLHEMINKAARSELCYVSLLRTQSSQL